MISQGIINQNLTGWQPLPKARSQLQDHMTPFFNFFLPVIEIQLALFVSHNFTPVIMPKMQ